MLRSNSHARCFWPGVGVNLPARSVTLEIAENVGIGKFSIGDNFFNFLGDEYAGHANGGGRRYMQVAIEKSDTRVAFASLREALGYGTADTLARG